MENSSIPQSLSLHFATQHPANIVVNMPILGNVPFFLGANRDTIIQVNVMQAHITGSEAVQNRGIFIRSDTAVSVISFNNAPNSSDAVSLIPLEYLPRGGRYILNSFRGSISFPSEFLVIATEDNTEVEITPAMNTRGGRPAGTPFTVMLQRGQTYQVQSAGIESVGGTRVRVSNGCKKIVVYSGARCSQVNYNVGCSGCDHLWAQEVPITFWGKEYHTVPVREMNSGYVLSFVASEDNTNILMDGAPFLVLNEGQNVVQNFNTNDIRCISSDKPISVVQLIKSGECNGHPSQLSDPSMFRLVPFNQGVKESFFRVPLSTNISSAFVTVICENPAEVFLNGNPINSLSGVSQNVVCGSRVSVTFMVISQYYKLTSETDFTAYLYGFGNAESYVLAMGSAYENLQLNFMLSPDEFFYCSDNQTFMFDAINEGYTNLRWDFDDGNFATGNQAQHQYSSSGRFEVKLIGEKANLDCPNDTVRKFITLFPPPFLELSGDTIVCKQPDLLIVPNTDPSYEFRWQNGSTAKNFVSSQDQTIVLTVRDENGCEKTDSMRVVFDECLIPKIEIPNVFTPGGDGLNDVLQITVDVFTNAECVIFNRWGLELYRYNPQRDLHWNGSVNNNQQQPCPDGTYFLLLFFTDPETNIQYTESAVITLIRERN